MNGLITVDIGTTSLRAIVYDLRGRMLHVEQRACAPERGEHGRVEQDARTWLAQLVEVLVRCTGATAGTVSPACLSVTAQRSSVLPVDSAGAPLHPTQMWQDTRCASLAQSMRDSDTDVYAKSGLRISPVFSAIKMAWLRKHRPEVWDATHKLLGVQDWVLHGLTGRFVTDHTFGSRTNLMNLAARDWDPGLLEFFGVPRRMLCDLVTPGAIVGGLTRDAARACGLPEGLPVVSAGGDQQCAALGLGLLAPGRAVSNAGTGSFVIGHALSPALDPQMRVSCNVSAVPGAYIVEAAMLTAGAARNWLEALTARPTDKPPTLDAEAAEVPAGARGLVVLPHFQGCGSPHWDPQARGAFLGLNLATTRGEIVRALLEAIAIELKEGLDLVEALCGLADVVHASGGMTHSTLFNRIQADLLERPLLRFAGAEATSDGAWIAGCVATGLAASHAEAFARLAERDPPEAFRPDPANKSVYRLARSRFRAVYDALAQSGIRRHFEPHE